jgi:hypothetical protein
VVRLDLKVNSAAWGLLDPRVILATRVQLGPREMLEMKDLQDLKDPVE